MRHQHCKKKNSGFSKLSPWIHGMVAAPQHMPQEKWLTSDEKSSN